MLQVIIEDRAPLISQDIKDVILSLDDINNFVLSLQLSYRDHNTIFYLGNLESIVFRDDLLHIRQWDHSNVFLGYDNILEYSVINAKGIIEIKQEDDAE